MNARSLMVPILIALGSTPPASAQAPPLSARWMGQDGKDFVGGEPGPAANEFQDVHIAVQGLPPAWAVAEVVLRGEGHGEWNTKVTNRYAVHVVRAPRSTGLDLYFEPYQTEAGRQFDVHVKFDNGQESVAFLAGGRADPGARVPGLGIEARWLGPDGQDRTGPGVGVGPDGFEDARIAVSRLSAKAEVRGVEVVAAGGLIWHAGLNPRGHPGAEFARDGSDPTRGVFYFSPGKDLAGHPLRLTVGYGDGRGESTTLNAGKGKPSAKATIAGPSIAPSKAEGRWLGQDGIDTVPGDVHLVVDGLMPGRQVVAASLGDGVSGTWMFRPDDKVPFNAGPWADRLNLRRSGPRRIELAFPPHRDETGATMTLRLLDASGRDEVIRFPGGAADVARRGPSLPSGSATAKPGDDLDALASRAGTVTLAPGVHERTRPLILDRPIRLVGQPGATVRFKQGADQPPWTAAIKVRSGGSTLEGFAVRFDGPVRWDWTVAHGPAVIGTTDDKDGGHDDPRFNLAFARLDLEGPPASTDWEQAPHSIRVMGATSGRVEGNTLKGGAVVFRHGPWTVAGNDYRGTLPKTFSYAAITGHDTHDVRIIDNHARDVGPSGKTWRFLVLAQRGAFDRVERNVIEGGIGPRQDDPHPHPNSPEVILTESYRLHFEGKPAAISPDGRVLTIPDPQGGPASTGDSVAILSGPQAGQWRSIALPIGPNSYLLDAPIPRETDAVSIATGFVRETFEGNTVDCRGSTIAANLVLAGNLFGVRIVKNRLIGGGETVRLLATPTESPIHWGWSHAPFLGGLFEGNTIEDSAGGGSFGLGVEHGPPIRSNKGRVYMTIDFKDNTLRQTSPTPKAHFAIGFPPSLDPKELIVTESGTKVDGGPADAVRVHSATINGQVVKDRALRK